MAEEITENPPRMCLSAGMWACYEQTEGDNEWEFVTVEHEEDPATAARLATCRKWTSGVHFILVVGLAGAYQYAITLETEGPGV